VIIAASALEDCTAGHARVVLHQTSPRAASFSATTKSIPPQDVVDMRLHEP